MIIWHNILQLCVYTVCVYIYQALIKMDTFFTLQILQSASDYHQQSSFNSNQSSISSAPNYSHQNHLYNNNKNDFHQYEEQCFHYMMEDDVFSSSSPNNYYQQQPSTVSHDPVEFNPLMSENWLSDIVLEAARAMSEKNSTRLHELICMLNELSSQYGDTNEKLAYYFLQALFSRMTNTGRKSYQQLTSAAERNLSFESTRETLLKFQEVSPWTTFGHTACNGVIMGAFEGESKLHIVDFSNTYCTQWPTLLELLATRSCETTSLRLTTVCSGASATIQKVMREISYRMEKFARLMGVPFKFNVIHHIGDLSELNSAVLDVQEDEALVINCVGSLHSIKKENDRRNVFLTMLSRLRPSIVTVVEEEADLDVGADGDEFVKGSEECLKWFRVYFECLDESFSKTSNERLVLERSAGRAVMDLVACPMYESTERRETANQWSLRLRATGFSDVVFSNEVKEDIGALLRRYKDGWTTRVCSDAGMFLVWKDQPVVWASAWKLS